MTSETTVVNIHDLAIHLSDELGLDLDEVLFAIKSYEFDKSEFTTPVHSPRYFEVPAAPRKTRRSCYDCEKDSGQEVLSFAAMMANVEAFKNDIQELEKLRNLYPDDHSLKSS